MDSDPTGDDQSNSVPSENYFSQGPSDDGILNSSSMSEPGNSESTSMPANPDHQQQLDDLSSALEPAWANHLFQTVEHHQQGEVAQLKQAQGPRSQS